MSAQGSSATPKATQLATQWEDVLLLEAMRYLRLSRSQLSRTLPLAQESDDRLSRLGKQEDRTMAALTRIAQKQREALVAGQPPSAKEQGEALLLERSRRQRREQVGGEIVQYVTPRLARILTREQARRAYLLAHGEAPGSEVARPVLLDSQSGFVLGDEARHEFRMNAVRQSLYRRYPAPLVDTMPAPMAIHLSVEPSTGSESKTFFLKAPESDVVFSRDGRILATAGDDGPNGIQAQYPQEMREALTRERGDLESRWAEPSKWKAAEATEEDLALALRPFVRRVFLSPRLRPVMAEWLERGGRTADVEERQ